MLVARGCRLRCACQWAIAKEGACKTSVLTANSCAWAFVLFRSRLMQTVATPLMYTPVHNWPVHNMRLHAALIVSKLVTMHALTVAAWRRGLIGGYHVAGYVGGGRPSSGHADCSGAAADADAARAAASMSVSAKTLSMRSTSRSRSFAS